MLAVAIKTKYLFNGKELQQQEFSDGSGLEEYDYKYRFYDQQLGVFHSQDRLAEKFSYMSPYQFCSNNPIWLREIDGLEGVKYTETEKNGEKKTIVEKNVVVLTKKTKEIPKNASKKTIAKIQRQNAGIVQSNQDRIEKARTELNDYYNGGDGGAKDSKGQAVVFKFNVIGVPDFDKNGLDDKAISGNYSKIGYNNSIEGLSPFDPNVTLKAPAAVFTNDFPGADPGKTNGPVAMSVSESAPNGTLAHEVLHTLGLSDNGYTKGGLLNNPPEPISSWEVDQVLKFSYDKKK